MYTSINGELCKIDRAYSGEIVILQNEFLKLNSVLGGNWWERIEVIWNNFFSIN